MDPKLIAKAREAVARYAPDALVKGVNPPPGYSPIQQAAEHHNRMGMEAQSRASAAVHKALARLAVRRVGSVTYVDRGAIVAPPPASTPSLERPVVPDAPLVLKADAPEPVTRTADGRLMPPGSPLARWW